MSAGLRRQLYALTMVERMQLLLLLADGQPEVVRAGLTRLRLGVRRKRDITILAWQIHGLAPEGTAGNPDRPAALG